MINTLKNILNNMNDYLKRRPLVVISQKPFSIELRRLVDMYDYTRLLVHAGTGRFPGFLLDEEEYSKDEFERDYAQFQSRYNGLNKMFSSRRKTLFVSEVIEYVTQLGLRDIYITDPELLRTHVTADVESFWGAYHELLVDCFNHMLNSRTETRNRLQSYLQCEKAMFDITVISKDIEESLARVLLSLSKNQEDDVSLEEIREFINSCKSPFPRFSLQEEQDIRQFTMLDYNERNRSSITIFFYKYYLEVLAKAAAWGFLSELEYWEYSESTPAGRARLIHYLSRLVDEESATIKLNAWWSCESALSYLQKNNDKDSAFCLDRKMMVFLSRVRYTEREERWLRSNKEKTWDICVRILDSDAAFYKSLAKYHTHKY